MQLDTPTLLLIVKISAPQCLYIKMLLRPIRHRDLIRQTRALLRAQRGVLIIIKISCIWDLCLIGLIWEMVSGLDMVGNKVGWYIILLEIFKKDFSAVDLLNLTLQWLRKNWLAGHVNLRIFVYIIRVLFKTRWRISCAAPATLWSLLKEASRRVFRKIRPSPIEWEPFNARAPTRTVIGY